MGWRFHRDPWWRFRWHVTRGGHVGQGEMAFPPVILVDGYNVLIRWLESEGKGPRLEAARKDRNDARQMLLLEVADYSQLRGIKLVVVFDALGNPFSSSTIRCVG